MRRPMMKGDDGEAAKGGGDADNPEPAGPQQKVFAGTGVFWRLALLFLLLAAAVIVVVQNLDPVPFQFLWFDADTSLAVLLLITALGTAVLTETIAAVWRHNRRRARTEREELARYRSAAS